MAFEKKLKSDLPPVEGGNQQEIISIISLDFMVINYF